jgi:hypothetical protein
MHARGANIREVSEDYLRMVEELDRVRAELDERRKLDKVLLQSEREAMLTMIAAMAVKGYAYSPGSALPRRARSPSASRLGGLASKLGVSPRQSSI